MTIYAIVNNLIAPQAAGAISSPIWTVISASAILQGGNPYFVPDFDYAFEARPALALRIGKLGKSIAPRFAHRYVDAVAPATLMVAPGLLRRLQSEGLPWSAAVSYDRSVAIGKFAPLPMDKLSECRFSLKLHSERDTSICEWSAGNLKYSAEDTISCLSRENALKTGDMILIGVSGSGPALQPGLRAVLAMDDAESLKFNIR